MSRSKDGRLLSALPQHLAGMTYVSVAAESVDWTWTFTRAVVKPSGANDHPRGL